jgi:hypothetical protein
VTRDGFLSGPGSMDYDHDMPPYIRDIVSWLDDPDKVHPCNGERAFTEFQVMMAACRCAVQRGKVSPPLGPGAAELEELRQALSECGAPTRVKGIGILWRSCRAVDHALSHAIAWQSALATTNEEVPWRFNEFEWPAAICCGEGRVWQPRC